MQRKYAVTIHLSAASERVYDSAAMHYWKEIFRRAFVETKKSVGSLSVKLAPTILAVCLQWWEFGVGSVKSWSTLAEFSLSLIEAYGLVFVGIYAWKLVTTVPALLHERDTVIDQRNSEIAKLTKPARIEFRGEILELGVMTWTEADNSSAMSVQALVRVRYLGNQIGMSVHRMQLWLVGWGSGSTIADGPWELKGKFMGPRRMDFVFNPIPSDSLKKAQAPGSQWKVTFRDHEDTEYESDVYIKPST